MDRAYTGDVMNEPRIKIFCRSFDLRLYRLSKGLYESWGYPCIRLTDQTADGYFDTMLKDTDCDIAINVDEDCFITSKEGVMALVEYVISNQIANAGCPDGGSYVPRGGNPLVTNPFFNVFNLNLIREKYSRKAVESFDYKAHVEEMELAYPPEMLYPNRKYAFDGIKYIEPYYPFFLWQAYNTRTLYLPSQGHPDGWTTILYNHLGQEICRHTWLARFYSVPSFVIKHWQPTAGAQKARIDAVIREAYKSAGMNIPQFGWPDSCAFGWNKVVRWMIKVPQRIAGWPKKIQRKLSK
jgi:hypothetical protein